VFFNAGCNEQVFSPKFWKKMAQIQFVFFEKNEKKNAHFNSEKWRYRAEG